MIGADGGADNADGPTQASPSPVNQNPPGEPHGEDSQEAAAPLPPLRGEGGLAASTRDEGERAAHPGRLGGEFFDFE